MTRMLTSIQGTIPGKYSLNQLRKPFQLIIACAAILLAATAQLQATIVAITSSDTFVVPAGVTSITAMVIGGGGAGTGTHGPGGGSGYLAVGTFAVIPGTSYAVTIGAGGLSDNVVGNFSVGGNGGTSSLGSLLTAAGGFGGSHPTFPTPHPNTGYGGSGGGGAGNAGFGGAGGSSGSNGTVGATYLGGVGQGPLVWADLSLFTEAVVSAGLGGAHSTGSHQGGGGGGGVLFNGFGIVGSDGVGFNQIGAKGGNGYGAGGGSSGYSDINFVYGIGGSGAAGLAVIQFVPEPTTLTMSGVGLIGLAAYGWRRRKRTLA